jgi:hypothetical protein
MTIAYSVFRRHAAFPEPGLAEPSDAFLTEVSLSSFLSTAPAVTVSSYRIGRSGEDSIRALVGTPSTITSGIGGGQLVRPADGRRNRVCGHDDIGGSCRFATAGPLRRGAQRLGWNVGAAGTPRWLTYVGGSGTDEATAIAQNWAGDLYVGAGHAACGERCAVERHPRADGRLPNRPRAKTEN